MDIFASVVYFGSCIALFAILLVAVSFQKKVNVLVDLPIIYVFYECYCATISGVLSLVGIPVHILSIGFINLIFAATVYWFEVRKRPKVVFREQFVFELFDIVFYMLYTTVVLMLADKRFAPGFRIAFETSDPSVHLMAALGIVQKGRVTSMFFSALTHALNIELMKPLFSEMFTYKSFIIQEVVNFFISGAVLYSCLKKYMTGRLAKVLSSFLIVVLTLGYAYNNLLFGFVYLWQTITVICALFFAVDLYFADAVKEEWALCSLSVLCVGIGIGYTLFVPPVFVALFFCILMKNKEALFSKKWSSLFRLCVTEFLVFIPAVALIMVYIVLGGENALGVGDLVGEGYIFRNLLFDFVLLLPFAMDGVYQSFKTKKTNLFSFLGPILLIYCLIMYNAMISGQISTYYYYKLNYLNWAVLSLLSLWSMVRLSRVAKSYLVSFGVLWILIAWFGFSGTELKLYQENVLFDPYPASDATFKIYRFNFDKTESPILIDEDLVALCEYIYRDSGTGKLAKADFIGYWMHLFWFRALCFDRYDTSVTPPDVLLEAYQNNRIEYLMVMKDSEEYRAIAERIDPRDIVFENNFGFAMKKAGT